MVLPQIHTKEEPEFSFFTWLAVLCCRLTQYDKLPESLINLEREERGNKHGFGFWKGTRQTHSPQKLCPLLLLTFHPHIRKKPVWSTEIPYSQKFKIVMKRLKVPSSSNKRAVLWAPETRMFFKGKKCSKAKWKVWCSKTLTLNLPFQYLLVPKHTPYSRAKLLIKMGGESDTATWSILWMWFWCPLGIYFLVSDAICTKRSYKPEMDEDNATWKEGWEKVVRISHTSIN